jgi:8-oxo-dGTP pyrophosphatase MutT (NUDIX family)
VNRAIQLFQVGLKAFVVRESRLLLLREAFGPRAWELPGGRIDVGEEAVSQVDVLRRELCEELGPRFRCEIGVPLVTWVRGIEPHRAHPALLIGFGCRAAAGEIELSDEHTELLWATREESLALDLAPGYADGLRSFWDLHRA